MAITINDIVSIQIHKDEIMAAIAKAKSQFFLDNLRNRHPNVSFDSKLRGYIGEIALKHWLENFNISFITNNYLIDDGSMDIDFLFKKDDRYLDIELKTSLIPDVDKDFEQVLLKRDIKLIRRNNSTIENLKSDIHIQIYFRQLRKAKDEWLKAQDINIESNDLDYLYECFGASRYLNDTYLFAWIDKPTLIEIVNSKPANRRTWSFAMREFWICNLGSDSKKPLDLIAYLQNF